MTAFKIIPKCYLILVITLSPCLLFAQVPYVDSLVTQATEPLATPSTPPNSEPVFTFTEQLPSFPNGEEAMMAYLTKKINYPAEAKTKKQQGVVYLSFIVEQDGSLSNITVKKGEFPLLNDEAVRVVKNMPKWIPAKHNGKTVRCNMSLPVRFKL